MKVISGGGGIDAEGNWYELPTVEREVPGDAFERAIRSVFVAGGRPTTMPVSRSFLDALDAAKAEE